MSAGGFSGSGTHGWCQPHNRPRGPAPPSVRTPGDNGRGIAKKGITRPTTAVGTAMHKPVIQWAAVEQPHGRSLCTADKIPVRPGLTF